MKGLSQDSPFSFGGTKNSRHPDIDWESAELENSRSPNSARRIYGCRAAGNPSRKGALEGSLRNLKQQTSGQYPEGFTDAICGWKFFSEGVLEGNLRNF